MGSEPSLFTAHMVTVFVEHRKSIDAILRSKHSMSSTEFCILRSLYLAGGDVDGLDFATYLMLRRNSVSTALASLAHKGYVEKRSGDDDRRMLHVTTTQSGMKAVHQATLSIFRAQKKTFWKNLDDADALGGNRIASCVLESMRGTSFENAAPLRPCNTPITPEFVVFCKAVPQHWTHTVKSESNLSLTELRVLSEISDAPDTRPSDIMDALIINRARMSQAKSFLQKAGLVIARVDAADRRNTPLSPTSEGKRLASFLRERLTRETDALYALCSPDLRRKAAVWHEKMYASMREMALDR